MALRYVEVTVRHQIMHGFLLRGAKHQIALTQNLIELVASLE